jgi:acetolactate synthase I/II/III large subunit
MAIADARLSGRPGVFCVSRGPGASNAAIAVHTAQQDEVPLILFIGQVPTRNTRRDSFQEIDYRAMYGSIAKWVAEVTDPARMAETLLRAIRTATAGTPGPVVIAVPENVLTAAVTAVPVAPQGAIGAAPRPDDIGALRRLFAEAARPLVLVGRSLDRPGGREALRGFLEQWDLPTVVSFRAQDLFPNAHRLYTGDMGLANPADQMAVLRRADLLIVLGARLSDVTTQGYTWPDLVRPQMRLVHIHPDPSAIGTHFAADLAIACDPAELIAAMGRPEAVRPDRAKWIEALAAVRRPISTPRTFAVNDGLPFEDVVALVGRHLPPDAIVTVDAGTFGAPVYRVIPFAPPQRLLAPIAGAMGFGIPAAVAAALRESGRPVIAFVGDGGFLMTGSELAVAMERKLPIKVILSENRSYASIWIQQEREYPGRAVATTFANPDLAMIGAAYGFAVTRILSRDALDTLPAILARPGPQFVIVETSLDAVRPRPTRETP